jgi:hypothetical protein
MEMHAIIVSIMIFLLSRKHSLYVEAESELVSETYCVNEETGDSVAHVAAH